MKKLKFGLLCLILPLAFSCSQIKNVVSSNSNQYVMKSPVVDIPRGIKNAVPAPKADDDKAIIVSPMTKEIYIGIDTFPTDVFYEVLGKRLEKVPDARQMLFLKAGANLDYIQIVRVLDVFRKNKIEDMNLLVDPAEKKENVYYQLIVKVIPEPKEDDINNLWLNYLMVKIDKTGKMTLGNTNNVLKLKDKTELKDESEAAAKIAEAFKTRAEKNLKGTNEKGKTMVIMPSKETKYSALARLIDAAKDAGAETIYLAIDDMYFD
jgi:biopolymer transport protein ExbD